MVSLAILAIPASIAAILALILLSPLQIKLMANLRLQVRDFQATFYTLWGALGLRMVVSKEFEGIIVLVGGRTIFRRRSRFGKTEGKKAQQPPSPTKVLQIVSRRGEVRRRGTDLFQRVLNSTRLDHVKVKLILGLPDPHDTGILYGHYQWAKAVLSTQIDSSGIEVEPVFDREVVELQAELALRIRIPRLIFPSLQFLLSKPIRQLR